TFGSLLAALAGAFTAPTVSVVPGLGVDIIVLSFAVVVIGGLGSLPGAALGAIIVGVVRSASVHYMPQVELFVIYFVMAMVLAFLPAKCRGICFGLLSLARSMILYGLLVKNEALGSTDGFNILPSTLFGIRPGPERLRYVVMASAAIVSFVLALVVNRYLRTP